MNKKTILSIFPVIALAGFLTVMTPSEAAHIGDEVQDSQTLEGIIGNFFDLNTGNAPVAAIVTDPGTEFTTHFNGDFLSFKADLGADNLLVALKSSSGTSFTFPKFTINFEDLH